MYSDHGGNTGDGAVEEGGRLERYLQENPEMTRSEAAGINPIKATMREKT